MPDSPKKKKSGAPASKQGSEKSGSKKAGEKEKSGKVKTDGSRPKSGDKSVKSGGSGKSSKGSSKKNGKGKQSPKGKRKDSESEEDRPASPEKKTIQETFYKYLCCFCCFRYKSRKMVRQHQRDEEQKRLEEEERERLLALQNRPADVIDEDAEMQRKKEAAAKRIQAIARGRIGRSLGEAQRKKVRDEANEFWKEVKRLHDLEQDRLRRIREARRQFTEQYVSDVVATSVQFIVETDAVSLIQRTWRGHWARMHLPRRRKPPRPPRPPKPFVSRFSAATLRRVWARREFEPEGGYYHNTDVGYLDYNIWEYVDGPPEGNPTGLRTYKIPAIPRSDKDKQILLNDKHAWVGLPVGFETAEVIRERVYRNRSESVRKVTDKSPYLASVVTHPTTAAATAAAGSTPTKSTPSKRTSAAAGVGEGSAILEGGESSLEEGSGSEDEYESSQDEERGVGNAAVAPKAAAADDDAGSDSEDSLAELKRLSRGETTRALEKLGFDDERSTKLPKLGTITFDPKTGRKIIHKGSNKWAELGSGAIVSLDKYEKLQWELELRESIEASSQQIANDSNSNNNSAILSAPYNLGHKAKVHHSKSGMISITNPHMMENSLFLEQHKAAFLQEYSHHSLTDHNRSGGGGGGVDADIDDDEELDGEFNYRLPLGNTARSPSKQTAGGGGGGGAQGGSFLTGLELDRSNPAEYLTGEASLSPHRLSPAALGASSLVLLGNPKGYTGAGVPIRGARKPKGKNMNKLVAAAEAALGADASGGRGGGEWSRGGSIHSKSLGYGPGFRPAKARPTARKSRPYKGTLKETEDGTAAVSGGVDAVWQNSSWGRLKKSMYQRAKDPALQAQVMGHVLSNTDIGRLDVSGRGTSALDNYYSDSETEELEGRRLINMDVDSDEDMRSRNVYKPRKKIVSKVVVWPQKPLKHYRLKYTWLPQPMLHNAVNNLYYDKSVADFYLSKETPQEDHYQTELNREKPRYIQTVNQLNMMSTVNTSYVDAPPCPSEFNDLEILQGEDDHGSDYSSSLSPVSSKHPERAKEVPLVHLSKVRVKTVPKHGPDSVSPNEASTMISSVTSFQDSNMSVASSISKYSYPANKYRPAPPSEDPPGYTGRGSSTKGNTDLTSPDKTRSAAASTSAAAAAGASELKPHSIHRYNSMNTIAEDTKSIVSPDDFMDAETPYTSNHFENSTERFPEEQHTDPASSRKFKFKFKKNVSFKKNASIHPYEFY